MAGQPHRQFESTTPPPGGAAAAATPPLQLVRRRLPGIADDATAPTCFCNDVCPCHTHAPRGRLAAALAEMTPSERRATRLLLPAPRVWPMATLIRASGLLAGRRRDRAEDTLRMYFYRARKVLAQHGWTIEALGCSRGYRLRELAPAGGAR